MAEIFDFYVADNRTIKFNPIEPILQEDNGVAMWRFRIPKVLNNIDMSGFAWWFVYINAAKQKYSEPLTLTADTDDPDNYCIADYTIDYGISLTPGSFTFALEAINANGSGDIVEEWHTKTYSHSVIQTLQGNQAEYSETESDIISALMVQIQEKYNALVGGATPIPVASISAMTDTSKIYLLTTDNNWYCYNGSTWVSGGLYASGIVIDPTLTQSGQAADAKVVGDEIDEIKEGINTFAETQILPTPYVLESGGINSSGVEITSDTQMRFKDYVPTSEAANIVFNTRSTSSNYGLFANYYNLVNGEYVFQSPRISTTGGYEIDTSYEYVRLSFYRARGAAGGGGADESLFRSWISWRNDATAKRFESIESQLSSFITCTENGYDIELGKALYNFRRVTDAGINVDTWRLYRGAIISESELVMWENSDAEGVVRLVGESDYIGGFHGDERYTNAVIYIDGQPATVGTAFARRSFKTLDIFVGSALYNAGTTEPDENSHVFNRFKYLHFEGHKVTISNRFTAVQNVKVLQAPLMLVQCNKNDSSGNLCFTNYTVDSDYRVFSTNSADVVPDRSNIAAQSTFITKNGTITARAEQIDPNYSNYYRCDTAAYFLTSQNRLKVYFNTIREVPAGIDVTAGNSILARFSITID